jgi:ketosteroid isomerase-like protein
MTILEKFSSFYTNLASMQVNELANIYNKDVVFIDPIAKHEGLSAVESYFTKLLSNSQHCDFTIHSKQLNDSNNCTVTWTMKFTSSKMNKGKPISVDGITMLVIENDKITYHRDYYDLGQMLYENVPLLGLIIKRIRRSLA